MSAGIGRPEARQPEPSDPVAAAWAEVASRRTPSRLTAGTASRRIERILQTAFGIGSLIIGAQSLLSALQSDLSPLPRTVAVVVLFGLLAIAIVLNVLGRLARVGAGAFAAVFPIAMCVLAAQPVPRWQPIGGSWMFLLVTLPVAAAAIAFPFVLQLAAAAVMPGIYCAVEMLRTSGQGAALARIAYDTSLELLIGLTIIALFWLFRSVAAGVDEARAAAATQYARAKTAEVAEEDRFEVATLMHDSVLAALLAACRAESDYERELAASMAQEALTRLANAESDEPEGSDDPVPSTWIRARLLEQAEVVAAGISIPASNRAFPGIPGRAARALVLAAAQAVANAVQHAGGTGMSVRVSPTVGGVEVVVRDRGPGFELTEIPADRLGIRASIIARVAAVGGSSQIISGGHGTTVRLRWPSSDPDGTRAVPLTGDDR